MKPWIWILALGLAGGASRAEVIISDTFSSADQTELSTTLTPVGNYAWMQTAGSGKFRVLGGVVVTQNNIESGKNPVAYLDYNGFVTSGQKTTMSLDAVVSDASSMRIGFGTLAVPFASDSSAFWVDLAEDGTVSFWKRSGGTLTQMGTSLDVKQTWSAVTSVELSYDHETGSVEAQASSDLGGGTTHTLGSTALGFTPAFNKFKIEVLDDGASTQTGYPNFDNLTVSVIPEPATAGMLGVAGVLTALIRRLVA